MSENISEAVLFESLLIFSVFSVAFLTPDFCFEALVSDLVDDMGHKVDPENANSHPRRELTHVVTEAVVF